MNKLFILALILSCLSFFSEGQDKIYLLNKNKLKGNYIPALSTDTTLYLEVFDRGVHIPYSLIRYAKFGNGKALKNDIAEVRNMFYNPLDSGYYYRLGLGTLIGSHSYWDDPSFSFTMNTIVGYRWSNFKNVGLKMGYDDYGDYGSIPIALHYEFDMSRRLAPPVLMAGIGYGMVWGEKDANIPFDKVRGGIHYYLNVGYRFKTGDGFVTLRIGGQTQHTVQKIDNPELPEYYYSVVYQKRRMRRLTMALDFTF